LKMLQLNIHLHCKKYQIKMTHTMEMYKTSEEMSFTAYYNWLQNQPNELRREIISQLEISEKTFYNRLQDNKFTYPQKLVISQILEKPIDFLFPEA